MYTWLLNKQPLALLHLLVCTLKQLSAGHMTFHQSGALESALLCIKQPRAIIANVLMHALKQLKVPLATNDSLPPCVFSLEYTIQ